MERLFWAALLWVLVGGALHRRRHKSPLDLGNLALVLTGLVGSFFPVLTLWVEPRTWRNVSHLPEEVLTGVQADYLACAAGLVLALGLLPRFAKRRTPRIDSRAWTQRRDAVVAWGLVALGATLYGAFVRAVGLEVLMDFENFAEKYRASDGLGPLVYGLNLIIAGTLWAEGGLRGKARLPFRAIALVVVIWSVAFLSARTYAVAVLLGFAFLFARERGLQLGLLRLRLVVLACLGFLCVEGFTLFRGAYQGDAFEALGEVGQMADHHGLDALGSLVGGSELSHPFVTAAEVARYEEPGMLGGQSYVETVGLLVPRFLVPDRPDTIASWFVQRYYSELAARGGGTAFSLVAEAWLNFGAVFGPFAIGLLAGLFLAAIELATRHRPLGFVARLSPALAPLVLLAHRNFAGILLKELLVVGLAAAAFAGLASLAWKALSRPPANPRRPAMQLVPGGARSPLEEAF